MLTISNKIEDYLQDENLLEYWYQVNEGNVIVKFGFKDNESYIKLSFNDKDGYLISEKKYIIPNRKCLKYIRYAISPLLKTIAMSKFEMSESHEYVYEASDYDIKCEKARLVKETIKKPNISGDNITTKLYKYRDDDLCEIRIITQKNYNTTDTQLITFDRERGIIHSDWYFLYERKNHRGVVIESSRILKASKTIWELNTPCGTVCTVDEYLPTINAENSYIHFDISVTNEDNIYNINSEKETIERISTEFVTYGNSRPRRLKCHKLYSVSRDMIEKMMMEE